jgi:hypothetical protein
MWIREGDELFVKSSDLNYTPIRWNKVMKKWSPCIHYGEWIIAEKDDPHYIKYVNRFHSDVNDGMWHVPAWFRRDRNRHLRRRNKQILRKHFVEDSWDEYVDEPFVKDVHWNWW